MRSLLLTFALLVGATFAGAQTMPTQQSPPAANPQTPGEPGTPPTFPGHPTVPPDQQTIPQAQTPQATTPDEGLPQEQTPQTNPTQPTNPDQANPMANGSNPVTVEGCLGGTSGNYSITDTAGNSYQLTGADRQLSKYVGHQVEVTGTQMSNAAGTKTPPPTAKPEQEESQAEQAPTNPAEAAGAAGQQTLGVSSVKEIAKSCSISPYQPD